MYQMVLLFAQVPSIRRSSTIGFISTLDIEQRHEVPHTMTAVLPKTPVPSDELEERPQNLICLAALPDRQSQGMGVYIAERNSLLHQFFVFLT
jgi:hypothetical protein